MTTVGDLVGRLVDLGVDPRQASTIIDEAVQYGATRPSHSKRKRAETAARATRIPPDWQPGAEGVQFAVDLGIPRQRIEREVANFKDYWKSATKNASKADWLAAWRIRMRQVADYLGCVPPKPTGGDNVTSIVDWAPILRRYEMTGSWNHEFGPAPGQIGYLGPKQEKLL